MLQILPLLLTDLDELKNIQPDGWSDITEPARNNIERDTRMAYKAVIDNRIVGMGGIIYNGNTAWLYAIIVHKEHRNKGIGTAITQFLLNDIDGIRFPSVFLDATDFGFPVYKKLGFEIISEHVHFESAAPDATAQLSFFIKPFEERYLNDILRLDQEATGEDRSAVLLENTADAWVYVSDDELQGSYMPSLARGLVIAKNAEAGIALMQARLKTTNYCMLPIENTIATEYLLQNGFKQIRTSKRMRLGQPVVWKPSYIFNVISGALG